MIIKQKIPKIKLKEVVENILEKDERARRDDKWLIFRVMGKFTKIFIPFSDFEKMPSFESITRCKRVIQNKENRLHNRNEEEELNDPCITYEKPIER